MSNGVETISSFSTKTGAGESVRRRGTGGWSEARRRAAAERIRRHRPWLRATGPRTAEGKARSARNSLKHGHYSAESRSARAFIGAQKSFFGHFRALMDCLAFVIKMDTTGTEQGRGVRPDFAALPAAASGLSTFLLAIAKRRPL